MSRQADIELEMRALAMHKGFRLFLLHVARTAGIFTPTAGAEQSLPYREGQRSLGLDIIRLAARGLPRGGSVEQMLSLCITSETTPQETDDETRDAESER